MLTVLTFTLLSFLLITAFYLNVTRKYFQYRNRLHTPARIVLCIIYAANLTGFIIAGYLILSNELEVAVDQWKIRFIINLVVLLLSTPFIYFSRSIVSKSSFSITKLRILLVFINIYPLVNVFLFYRQ